MAQQVDSVRAKAQYGFKNEELKVIAELDRTHFIIVEMKIVF